MSEAVQAAVDDVDDDAKQSGSEADDAIIADAKKFYALVEEYESENRTNALTDKEFMRGGAYQWDQAAWDLRQVEQRPRLTINVLPSFIQQVTNDQRQNKTNIKTHPVAHADDKINEVVQGAIKHIEYASNADVAYDRALQSATEIGFGYWRLITDYQSEDSFDQIIKFSSFRNPFMVFFDPRSTEPDGSDQKRCLIALDVPKEEFEAEYPDAQTTTDLFPSGTGLDAGWINKDSVRVAEFYRIEEEQEDLYLMPDGKTLWGSEIDQLFASPMAVQLPFKKADLKCRKSSHRKVMWYKLTAAEILDRAEIKSYWIPVFPVWGTEIDVNGKVDRRGMIRDAKDPAKMYNVTMSAATEEIASRSKAPWIGAVGQFEGQEKKWRQANRRNFPYLEYVPKTVDGQLAPPPQRQAGAEIPAGFLTMAGHARDDIKATTGIFDASLGAQGNETSGKAINARKNQGEKANFHYSDNLFRTQRHCARVMLKMFPNYYDATRTIKMLKEDGTVKSAVINQPTPEGQAPIDPETGAVQTVLNDVTVAEFDVTCDSGPSYSTQRLEAQDAMVQLAQGNPKIMDVAGDIVLSGFDFKGADKLGERYKYALIPPVQQALASDVPDSPEVASVKQAAGAQINTLNQHLQGAVQGIQERDKALADLQQKLNESKLSTEKEQIKQQAENQRAQLQQEMENQRIAFQEQLIEQRRAFEDTTNLKLAEIRADAQRDVAQINGSVQMILKALEPPPAAAAELDKPNPT